jgi:hypothetical protein
VGKDEEKASQDLYKTLEQDQRVPSPREESTSIIAIKIILGSNIYSRFVMLQILGNYWLYLIKQISRSETLLQLSGATGARYADFSWATQRNPLLGEAIISSQECNNSSSNKSMCDSFHRSSAEDVLLASQMG